MLNRRDFIRLLSTGGALFSWDPTFAFARQIGHRQESGAMQRGDNAWQAPFRQAVWKDVDVVVVGATAAGVAAALSAAENGARVFLVSSLPYMGEDICASFLYWQKEYDHSSELFRKIFPGAIAPYPLHVKSVLENELLIRNVEFVYSSFASTVLLDGQRKIAGVCIVNRSGQRLIRAKVVIDATHNAIVAQRAGIPFHPFQAGEHLFRFVVVGNREKKDSRIVWSRKIYPAFNVNGKSLHAWEYWIRLPLASDSYAALMEAEQTIRDLTWDVDQIDSADIPYYIPSSYMKSRDPFVSDEMSNLFVLGPCSSISREQMKEKMTMARFMEQGETIGKQAAQLAFERSVPTDLEIKPLIFEGIYQGDIRIGGTSRNYPPLSLAYFRGGSIPVIGDYDVVVTGGGTAGAPATIASARHGAKTLLLEYLHGLGGIGTFGLIGRYTAGHRKGFTEEVDHAMRFIAPADHPRHLEQDSSQWPLDWKAEWYRQEIRKAGGTVWFQVIAYGVLQEQGKVIGVLVQTPLGPGLVRCRCVVDSTGSADLAIAAGAAFEYTGKESLAVQGAGLSKYNPGDHYNNSDWTFVDDTDVEDVTRLFIQCKLKNQGNYDIGKLPQTRERRRIVADFNVSVFDMLNERSYPDTLSYHISNFDTHGFTEDIYFTIRPPEGHKTEYKVKLPLRSLLPKGLDGILVTGLGCGSHRDAMPVIRMQPDLQNQGYAAGLVAAISALQKIPIRKLDVKGIQRLLVEKGNLPQDVLQEQETYDFSSGEMEHAVRSLSMEYNGLEKVLAFPDRSIPLLKEYYRRSPEKMKIYYANVLCMLGVPVGWKTVLEEVRQFNDWDKGWDYRGMHQFGASMSRLDNYLMALGYSKHREVRSELLRWTDKLTKQTEFSHVRAVSVAIGKMPSSLFVPALVRFLQLEGMSGHHIGNQQEAIVKIVPNIMDYPFELEDSSRNRALKELYGAKALYLCGDQEDLGKHILENYAKGIDGHYARYAQQVLACKNTELMG